MLKKLMIALACGAFVAAATPVYAQDGEDPEMVRDLAVVQKPIYDLGGGSGARLRVRAWVDKTNGLAPANRCRCPPTHRGRYIITVSGQWPRDRPPQPLPAKAEEGGSLVVPSPSRAGAPNGKPGHRSIKVIASREPLTLQALSRLASKSCDRHRERNATSGSERPANSLVAKASLPQSSSGTVRARPTDARKPRSSVIRSPRRRCPSRRRESHGRVKRPRTRSRPSLHSSL